MGLNFFATMRIPILAGRTFTSARFRHCHCDQRRAKNPRRRRGKKEFCFALDTPSARPRRLDRPIIIPRPSLVIINESFARKFLANQNPIGLHMGDARTATMKFSSPGPGYTIIGIVGDTKYAYLRSENRAHDFSSACQQRSAISNCAPPRIQLPLMKSVREIVSQAGDNLPLTDVRTQTEQIEQTLFQERLMSRLSSFFGALALVLACIGLYGLLSYEVARRTRELGIRMALGAQQRDLLRLVVGQGILLALIGVASASPRPSASRVSWPRCSMACTRTIR